MGKNTEFPWELLKAECLRVVCTQLVQGSSQDMNNYPLSRKDEMIEFLRDVEARSLDAAVKTLELAPRKTAGGGDEAASPPKRKAVHSEEETNDEEGADGYNTRFKGIKRVKVREATPEPTSRTPRRVGRPRKSIPSGEGTGSPTRPKGSPQKSAGGSISAGKRGPGRPRKSVPEGAAPADTSIPAVAGEKPAESAAGGEVKEGEPKEGATTDTPAKRGRGRPRKSDVVAPKAPRTPKTPKAASAAKPPALDADGNPKRGRGRPRKSIPETTDKPSSKGKQVFDGVLLEKRKSVVEEPSAAEPEAPAAGEAEEEDAVLAAVQNGNNGEGDLSSLGGSNKENEPHDAFRYTPTDHDVDMDADGDPDGEAEPVAAPPVTVV